MAKSDPIDNAAPTTDKLRHDIDSGKSGDKVAFPDPSAAPLGTDAEAGGVSPDADERTRAYRAEVADRKARTGMNASAPDDRPIHPPARGTTLLSLRGAVAVVLLVIVVGILISVLLPAAT